MKAHHLSLALFVAGIAVGVVFVRFDARSETRGNAAGKSVGPDAAVPDRAGPVVPKRIICAAPSITECVFALGCGDRVKGVTRFCTWPPAARRLPRIGGYIDPNLERIMTLRPDLVVVLGKHDKLSRFCRDRQIQLLSMSMSDLCTLEQEILNLAGVLGCAGRGRDLVFRMESRLAEVKAKVAKFPRRRVFLCLGRMPGSLSSLYTVGRTSFLHELLLAAGGDNVFADMTLAYPQASKESLLRRAPEVIVEVFPGQILPRKKREQLLRDWQSLPTLPAVRAGRIVFLTDDFLQIPGPRLGEAAMRFARAIHPEAFAGGAQ